MDLTVTLSQSSAAKKLFAVTPRLRALISKAIKDVVTHELPSVTICEIGIVTLSDEELLQINIQSLGHDWYTDILTFELERTPSGRLEAELYFSVERALENAKRYRKSIEEELLHLAIHGILHLAGHDDHDPAKKKRMAARERFFISKHHKLV